MKVRASVKKISSKCGNIKQKIDSNLPIIKQKIDSKCGNIKRKISSKYPIIKQKISRKRHTIKQTISNTHPIIKRVVKKMLMLIESILLCAMLDPYLGLVLVVLTIKLTRTIRSNSK